MLACLTSTCSLTTAAYALSFTVFARACKVPWAAIAFVLGSCFSAIAPHLTKWSAVATGLDATLFTQQSLLVAFAVGLTSLYAVPNVLGACFHNRERHVVTAAPTLVVANKAHKTIDDVPDLVAEMRASFKSGHTRGYASRMRALKGLERLFLENEDAIIEALKADLGRPVST